MDPDSPDIKVGIQKGKTKVNGCCACDKYVDYYTENKLKGQTVRAACCDICLHSCFAIEFDFFCHDLARLSAQIKV